jgi:hypothetical protein
VKRRAPDPLDRPFPMSGQEGREYGATITFENADGKVLVVHRAGSKREAIMDAWGLAQFYDPSFRIVSISTPQTIYADLQGARLPRGGQNLAAIRYPETDILAGVRGGTAMLHPRLLGSSDRRKA